MKRSSSRVALVLSTGAIVAAVFGMVAVILSGDSFNQTQESDSGAGGWTAWTSWTLCPFTCGINLKERRRTCSNPVPAENGRMCVGRAYDEQPCNVAPCPVDGKWGDWSSWSSCSVSCEGGLETKYRACDSPLPRYQGKDCSSDRSDHESEISRPCNTEQCPINPETNPIHFYLTWAAWGEWTSSELPTANIRYREQLCLNASIQIEVGVAECAREFGDSQLHITEISGILPLPWTETFSPEPGGDCASSCPTDCPVVAYSAADNLCYLGDWNSSAPLVIIEDVSRAWTLRVLEQGQRSRWKLESETSNIMALGLDCMTNVVLPHLNGSLHLGQELTYLNPRGIKDNDEITVFTFFRESGEFLWCGFHECYTWHFGQTRWHKSHISQKYLRYTSYTFVDDAETKLILIGGMRAHGDIAGTRDSQYFTLGHGFEPGPELKYAAFGMGVEKLPGSGLLYCGGLDNGVFQPDCWIYNFTTDTTREVTGFGVLQQFLFKMVMFPVQEGKEPYVLATSGAFWMYPELYKYSLERNTWRLSHGPESVYAFFGEPRQMVVLGNKVYGFWFQKQVDAVITNDVLVFGQEEPYWQLQGVVEQEPCYGVHSRYEFNALITV